MIDRISPPSWTEWTRNPNERSPQRKAFDDLLGDLRKEGLIEARGSLFVHLARYSYLHVKNARISVKSFLESVPDSIFRTVPPNFRQAEVDTVLKILVAAGLAVIEEEVNGASVTARLTEKQSAGEVARGQEIQTVLAYLRRSFSRWDPMDLVSHLSSFPTPELTAKATGVDRAHLTPGNGCAAVQDKPETNENNPNPFLQDTIETASSPLVNLQFWPLPDQKGSASAGPDPEFTLLIPMELTLSTLVRSHCLPLFEEFFKHGDHHDAATEIQAKYASYMHKYREKFTSAAGTPVVDRIDKVLVSTDTEGEAFANAVYVVAQVLRSISRAPASSVTPRAPGTNIVYQAARIAYACAMAVRVKKRQSEKESSTRVQDSGLLVARLKESLRPLTVEDLKKTADASKNKELGLKYASVLELLPLAVPKDGSRPLVYEIRGLFLHRENLLKTFLDLRDREALAQRERLALEWAHEGIPHVEELHVADRELSAEFLKALELVYQERILAPNLVEFLKDFLPNEKDLGTMAGYLWPEGHRGIVTPAEIVIRGLDTVLYEDKDRLRKRSIVGVLDLASTYPQTVKAAWNIVFQEDGVFRFVIRRIMAFFGGRSRTKPKVAQVKKGTKAPTTDRAPQATSVSQKLQELKLLKEIAPILRDRDSLIKDREKAASQWCLKLDPEASRRTRQTVDDEVSWLVNKIAVDQLSEDNGTRVALFMVERSPTLAQVTPSRAFNRYLYLTALLRRAEALGR